MVFALLHSTPTRSILIVDILSTSGGLYDLKRKLAGQFTIQKFQMLSFTSTLSMIDNARQIASHCLIKSVLNKPTNLISPFTSKHQVVDLTSATFCLAGEPLSYYVLHFINKNTILSTEYVLLQLVSYIFFTHFQ